MGISLYRIKKWAKMLTGKSILHVNQDIGKHISTTEIRGYYNNLKEKVTKDAEHIDIPDYIPKIVSESGKVVEFSIAVIQYGLGCYDLYIEKGEQIYLDKALCCADWALAHQMDNGAYDTFSFIHPTDPYSAMCQGEATSLLLRAFVATGDEKYKSGARAAVDYMLKPLDEGGVTDYSNGGVRMLEYTNQPPIMNGWIFALFGLYDAALGLEDKAYSEVFERSIFTLKESLTQYDNGYWTMYDSEKRIASPFYHNLHIAQMQALHLITGDEVFESYGLRWKKYQKNPFNKARAFVVKAMQKIRE